MNFRKFNNILSKLEKGDYSALEQIYNEYYNTMIFISFSVLHNWHDSEDNASNVLLKLANFRPQEKIKYPKAWIRTITQNCAKDYIKKESKLISYETDSQINPQNYVVYPSNDIRLDFESVFSELTEEEQNLFLDHYYMGYKLVKIAKIYGVPDSTIRWKMAKIKEKFKRVL